jgi:hypothetical protein
MPGIATHMAIADIIAEQLNEEVNIDEIKKIIQNNEAYFKMGSLGPDMLFFAPDYGDEVRDSLYSILEFYDDYFEPLENFYDSYIQPAVDLADDVTDMIDETLFCNTMNELGTECELLMERFFSVIGNGFFLAVNNYTNVFDLMQPAIQKGEDERSWYWFDMLHYRKTGEFAKNMWDRAQNNQQKAFVFGYLTHIGSDITGHPYVNTAVGGPARSHNQRHHFVENMIDTWVYDELFDQRFTDSKLYQELPYGREAFDRNNGRGTIRSFLRQADTIPQPLQDIFEMTSQSLQDTFQDGVIPEILANKYLTPNDYNIAYFAVLASLKLSTDSYIPKPNAPTDGMLDTINNAIEEFLENASNPPTNHASSSNMCYSFWRDDCDFSADAFEDLLENIYENIAYLGEMVMWTASLLKDIWNIVACTATAPIKLLAKSLLWIIQTNLHTISQEMRHALVLAAFVAPEPEWLAKNPIAQTCVSLKDRTLNNLFSGKGYPHRAQQSNEGFLAFPQTPIEFDSTYPGPYNSGSTPLDFIENAQLDERLYEKYKNAESFDETQNIERETLFTPIGSSISISILLMKELYNGNNLPNWNLDSDRGFGYKTWSVDAPENTNPLAWNSNDMIKGNYI